MPMVLVKEPIESKKNQNRTRSLMRKRSFRSANLKVHFWKRQAVDGVTIDIKPGETLGS